MLEPQSVRLLGIGGQAADRSKQWGTLEVRLKDTELDHTYQVDLKLLVPKRPDATLMEMQEVARASAVLVLRQAADLLERETIEAMEQQEAQRHAADAARLRQTFLGDDGERR
jgi:hypothetical protein